jgi:hypothetical protein
MEEPGPLHDAALVRIRQPDRTGGAALPVADEKGRDRRLRCESFRLAFPSLVRDVCAVLVVVIAVEERHLKRRLSEYIRRTAAGTSSSRMCMECPEVQRRRPRSDWIDSV